MPIDRNITIEDLLKIPGATTLLIRHGLPCLVCGEPAWGTLDDLLREEDLEPAQAGELLRLLNNLVDEGK